MKAIHIVAGIIGISVLFAAAASLRSKMNYDRDGREIQNLIAEYKAMGIATNGDEHFHRIPDSENGWMDIGPILFDKHGTGTTPLYRTGIAMDLILAGNRSNLPDMHRYLAVNQSKRDAIARALIQKPKFQVPHDYDEGYALLLPEFSSIRGVCRDYCLQAYVNWLENKPDQAQQDFDVANRMANACIERNESIGNLVGLSIHRIMLETGLRLVEVDPSLRPEVAAYLNQPGLFRVFDIKKTLKTELLMQITGWRQLDSPLRDKRNFPAPLDRLFPPLDEVEIEKDNHAHHGDYVPQSAVMRRVLLSTLRQWMPLMKDLAAHPSSEFLPSYAEYHATNSIEGVPQSLKSLLQLEDGEDGTLLRDLYSDRTLVDANQFMWKALDYHAKAGKYPASLADVGHKMRLTAEPEGFTVESGPKGFILKSIRLDSQASKPAIQYSYPVSLRKDPQAQSNHAEVIKNFHKKVIDYRGVKQ